jgi:hypothetical protein
MHKVPTGYNMSQVYFPPDSTVNQLHFPLVKTLSQLQVLTFFPSSFVVKISYHFLISIPNRIFPRHCSSQLALAQSLQWTGYQTDVQGIVVRFPAGAIIFLSSKPTASEFQPASNSTGTGCPLTELQSLYSQADRG